MPELIIHGNFRIMSVLAHTKEVECLRCGCEFEIDTFCMSHMVWMGNNDYGIKCPLCGSQEQKPSCKF